MLDSKQNIGNFISQLSEDKSESNAPINTFLKTLLEFLSRVSLHSFRLVAEPLELTKIIKKAAEERN